MLIDIKELQIIVDKLKINIDKYHLNHLNYYNMLNSATTVWKENKTEHVVREFEKQKADVSLFIDSLKSYVEIFDNIIEELSFLDGKISVNLDSEEKLMQLLTSIIEDINKIIDIYENLNITDDLVYKHIQEFNTIKTSLLELKKYLDKIFRSLNELNITTNSRLNNIGMPIIKEEELA